MKYILMFFGALFIFYSCNNEPKKVAAPYQFKDYYYPIEDLRRGKVYVYAPVNNDSLEGYYLYLVNQGGYLIGTTYNAQLKTEQITTEDVLSNGTALHRFRLCEYFPDNPDICQPIDVEIESPSVFPFEMRDSSSVFLYDVSWTGTDSVEYNVIRNRHFMGFESVEWKGKTYEGVKFGIREEITAGREVNGYQTFKAFTEEYYAKGIGLVHSKKNIDNKMFLEFELADTTNMAAMLK